MQDAFEVLQCSHVLEKVASFAHTEQGRQALLSLRPYEDEDKRALESRHLEEAMALIDASSALPLSESSDLSMRVDVARKGGTLEPLDFSRVLSDLQMLRDIKKHLAHCQLENPLKERLLSLPDLEPLRQGILRVLAPDLSVKDSASVELKRIRSTLARRKTEITSKLGQILEKHRPYLSGNSWTMRNGHYVLPIANSHKNKVPGIIQDVSSSGNTTFIEPDTLVRAQNEIVLLEAEEKEEVRRILASLSRILGGNAKDFLLVNETIGYADFLQAKVLYAQEVKGHIALKSADGSLFLPAARHPLLPADKVVANDFALSASRRILVLSGPNAGGKTVAEKTLGILAMMFLMALPLPCGQGAEVPAFHDVLLDIGDSQSIFDNLSTFSGHVTNIKDILAHAEKGDLILLDEVGTGTSPKEGEALALAILDELRSRGCYALISSHYEGLKAFALSSSDVENACLLFNEDTLTPTYSLRVGIPGESYGIEVARRLGLPEPIVAKAQQYLDENSDLSVSASLKHLSELIQSAEEKEKQIAALKYQIATQEEEIRRKAAAIEKEKRVSAAQLKVEREKLLDEARAQVEEAIAALKNPEASLKDAAKAKRALDDLEEKEPESEFHDEIHLEDYVEVPDYGIEGKVTRIKGNSLEVVTRDGVSFHVGKTSARRIPKPKEEKKPSITNIDALPGQSLSLELNIIGMRVDEAMVALDRYLDRCRLKGFKRVRIIHGLGSGALRKATHEYCKSHPKFIEKCELGGEFEGGGGATVVYLK